MTGVPCAPVPPTTKTLGDITLSFLDIVAVVFLSLLFIVGASVIFVKRYISLSQLLPSWHSARLNITAMYNHPAAAKP